MYSVWSNIKFYTGIVLWFLIVVGMIIVGWGMSFTSIDLAAVPKTTGIISAAGTRLTSGGRVGNLNTFVFQVNQNPAGYWIYRANGNYTPLYNSLKAGTEVTIYHSGHTDSNGLYQVYQVQNGSDVYYAKAEYEGKEKLAGRLIVLPGAVLLLIMTFFKVRKRIRVPSA